MGNIKYVVTKDLPNGRRELIDICTDKKQALHTVRTYPDCQIRNERGYHVTREELERKSYKPENWGGVVWLFYTVFIVVFMLNLIEFVHNTVDNSILSVIITTLLAFIIYWAGMFEASKRGRR